MDGSFDPQIVAAFLTDKDGSLEERLSLLLPGAKVRLFPPLPKEEQAIHASLHIALCLREAGIPIEPLRALERARRSSLIPRYCLEEGRDMVLLHPGSGGREKNYPSSFWVELLREVARKGIFRDARPKVLIGPAEVDKEAEFRKAEERGLCTVAVVLERRRLHIELSSACFFVGHDSGVTHLAAMMGLHTIALFRKSNPAVWHPLGPHVRVFTEEADSERLLSEILAVLSCHSSVTKL
jgi:ADP-heptose:LPS heptosyltransferase